mgnify:CR=1 FL=1
MIEVKKKEGETSSALMFRFTKRVKRSGVLKESNKRRFYTRTANKQSRRNSAIYRAGKKVEVAKARKLSS